MVTWVSHFDAFQCPLTVGFWNRMWRLSVKAPCQWHIVHPQHSGLSGHISRDADNENWAYSMGGHKVGHHICDAPWMSYNVVQTLQSSSFFYERILTTRFCWILPFCFSVHCPGSLGSRGIPREQWSSTTPPSDLWALGIKIWYLSCEKAAWFVPLKILGIVPGFSVLHTLHDLKGAS